MKLNGDYLEDMAQLEHCKCYDWGENILRVFDGDIRQFIVPKYWRYDIGSESGVMDIDGNVIIPAKYYMVRIVDDNHFEVEVTCGGERILVNAKGQYVGKTSD